MGSKGKRNRPFSGILEEVGGQAAMPRQRPKQEIRVAC
jgi:hypothetical protein